MKSDQKLDLTCDFQVTGLLSNGKEFSSPGQAFERITPYKSTYKEVFVSFAKDALDTFLALSSDVENGSEIEQLSVTIQNVRRMRADGSTTSDLSKHLIGAERA